MENRITICVPIYGVEKYIERCAISLLEQTYPHIQYLFINDCTKDKSIDILNEVIKRYPNRFNSVKIINHNINKGLAAARNTAVAHCETEFLTWVDSDDYIERNAIELLLNKQKEGDYDIVSSEAYVHTRKGVDVWKLPKIDISPLSMLELMLKEKVSICIWGRLIRTSLYKDNDIKVIEGLNMGEDYQVSPLLVYYSKRVAFLNVPLYNYDMTNVNSYVNSFSENTLRQGWKSKEVIVDFFNERDKKFSSLANYRLLSTYLRHKLVCVPIYKQHQEFYKELIERIKIYEDSELLKLFSIPYRLVLKIENPVILKLYLKISQTLLNILKSF